MENISEKAKLFLTKKSEFIQIKIKKLKRKRKIIKIIYYTSVVTSISISTLIASLTGFVPAVGIATLSISSGILTAISAKFNLHAKKTEIQHLITKLNKLNATIDYVISCNGNLSQEEYNQILKEY